MSKPRILVAGVGNIFFGDDAFGCEVARLLAQRPLPAEVKVIDFGIRGLDLAYAILDQPDAVVIIDATPRGRPPGTLYVIEPKIDGKPRDAAMTIETHGMDLARVFDLVAQQAGRLPRVVIVGCEPRLLDGGNGFGCALSEPVQAAVHEATAVVEELVTKLLAGTAIEAA